MKPMKIHSQVKPSVRIGWLVALALAAGVVSRAGAQILELEPRAVVSGARVLLQDIVRPGISLPEGWGTRSIAAAPSPRETKVLPLTEVAQAMNEYDDMRHVVLRGKPVIQVSAKHRSVDVVRIQQAVDDYTRVRDKWQDRRFEVAADLLSLPHVPEGTLDVEVVRMREKTGTDPVSADIQLIVDGESYGEGPVTVELMEMQPFWAATRPLVRGESLTTDMIEMRWLAEREPSGTSPATHPIEGMELRRNVQAGQLLASGMLAEPVYARRGEIVRVVSRRGGLTVTLRARALANGRREERILCLNEQSGRRMQVRLVQPRAAILEDESGDSAT